MRTSLRAVGGLVGAVLIGCSLNITRLTFDLPKQTYSFDTSMWGNLPPAAVGLTFPSIPCGADADCCGTAAKAAGWDCQTTPTVCDTGSCEPQIPESTSSSINLAMQVGALATFPGHSLLDVTIGSITYAVSDNTLNVDLPPMEIYLAPDGVTDPHDPNARLFGTVPSIPAGSNPMGAVQKTSNADAVFEMYTKNVSTPFNVIGATTVVIAPGTPVPTGHITVTVGGTVTAQL
jgi:hypothetical protein